MTVGFRGGRLRRYGLVALGLATLAAPANATREPGTEYVQHEFKFFGAFSDAILNGEKHVRKKAGKMLAEGDCAAEAKSYALRKGRFDVASAVDRHCAPTGRQMSELGSASSSVVGWRP